MITDDQPPDENAAPDASRRSMDIRTPPRKLKAARKSDTYEENWDDEFAFSAPPRTSKIRSSVGGVESLKDRVSFEKDSSPLRTPRRDLAEGLRAWSESPNSIRHRTPGLGPKQEENWDDDFAGDNGGSPARSTSASASRSTKKKRRQSEEVENWDDEFGILTDPGSPRPTTVGKKPIQELVWESSDDESPGEMGFNDRDDEEDKTVTSKHRRKPLAPLNRGDVPPLPPLSTGLPTIHAGGTPGTGTGTWSMPSSPFPRSSPNHSVFSIPATITTVGGRESTIADSTAHLALRRTHSAESSGSPLRQTFSTRYGPSSPPRERRRLRKKSRPPRLDASILELDDRTPVESLPPFHPSTPDDERPRTPPHAQRPPLNGAASSVGGLLSPTTPSSMLSPPLSPSSKSPLLQRIGSMKKWGSGVRRMRISTSSADPSSSQAPTSALSPKHRTPPAAFLDESNDRDRRDLNRTPRPHSYIAPSARRPADAITPIATPSTVTKGGRFFRSSSRDMERERQRREASASRPSLHETLPIGPQSSVQVKPLVLSKAEKAERKEKEKLRVLVPRAIAPSLGAAQSSQSGESELGSSPRRARIRAFGQKLLSGSGVASGVSRAHSPDSAHGTNSSEGGDSRRSSFQYHSTPPPMSAPLANANETSKLKPRLQGQGIGTTSSLRIKGVFPRHVSGSVLHEKEHQERKRQLRAKNPLPMGVHAPGFGVAGRSVSATTVGSNRTGSSENADHSGGDSASTSSHVHAPGHRHFMGSMRRISLTNRRSKTDDGRVFSSGAGTNPGSEHSTPDRAGKAPELPKIDLEADPFSKHPNLLRLQSDVAKNDTRSPKSRTFGSHIDLASPKSSSAPLDWGGPPPVPASASNSRSSRKSGEGGPVLSHSKSSSFATGTTSSSKTASSAGTVMPGRGSGGVSLASQAASLSRASPLPVDPSSPLGDGLLGQGAVHRRNSLGDLKIPTRISKAQDGLKRDLGRVREFASCVEHMQDLRSDYFSLASRIHEKLETITFLRPASRASITSPTSIFRSNSRQRSHTTSNSTSTDRGDRELRMLAVGFQRIDAKYAVAWECADLLIELGTGSASETVPQAHTPPVPPQPSQSGTDSKQSAPVSRTGSWRAKNRERAVTLAGDEGKPDLSPSIARTNVPSPRSPGGDRPPPNVSWRASTGRHDLGHRQLYLLKEMLSTTDAGLAGAHLDTNLPPELCGLSEGMDSSLTLQTEESAISASQAAGEGVASPSKTRKPHRLGMIGIRDMLRSLKRKTTAGIITQNQSGQRQSEGQQPGQSSSTVNTHTTDASSIIGANGRRYDNHPYNYNTVAAIPVAPANARRKSETSAALQMHMHMADTSFTSEALIVSHKSSPRRPSLASLFRIGQKHKAGATGFSTPDSKEQSRVRPGTADSSDAANRSGDLSSLDDSDWDRMDSMSDLEHQRLASQAQNGVPPHLPSGETASTKTGTTVKLHRKKQSKDAKQDKRPSSPTFKLPFGGSQVSFTSAANATATPNESVTNLNNFRAGRLSNVDENADSAQPRSPPTTKSRRPVSRSGRDKDNKLDRPFSSVRTVAQQSKGMPSFGLPAPNPHDAPNVHALPDLKLAMTPENIKPLLENAKVVTTRLVDCLSEVRMLLGRVEGGSSSSAAAGTESALTGASA